MIFRCASLALAATLFTPFVVGQTSTWHPDKAHSSVDFSVLHLSISKVRGHFDLAGGEVLWNQSDITKSSVTILIDLNSINTGVERRDADLKSDSFFDTAKTATATFKSTQITKTADGLSILGDLSLHGVSKPVTLRVEGPTGPVTGMDKKTHMGFSGTTTLDRSAFNLGTKYPTAVIGQQIPLTIDLDLAKE